MALGKLKDQPGKLSLHLVPNKTINVVFRGLQKKKKKGTVVLSSTNVLEQMMLSKLLEHTSLLS